MTEQTRILLVEAESSRENWAQDLKSEVMENWEMTCVQSSHIALEMIVDADYQVVVAGIGEESSSFLTDVWSRNAQCLRFAVVDGSQQKDFTQTGCGLSEVIAQPFATEIVVGRIRSALAIRQQVAHQGVVDLFSRMKLFPRISGSFFEMTRLANQVDCTPEELGAWISENLLFQEKFVRLTGVAFGNDEAAFQFPTGIVQGMGIDWAQLVLLGLLVYSQFEEVDLPQFSTDLAWRHGLAVGYAARRVLESESASTWTTYQAFISGLLQEIGQQILAANLRQEYLEITTRASQDFLQIDDVEREVLGATRSEVGAYFLQGWGFPTSVLEAVAWHANPSGGISRELGPLPVVHVVASLVPEMIGRECPDNTANVDLGFLGELGLSDSFYQWQSIIEAEGLQAWRHVCLQPPEPPPSAPVTLPSVSRSLKKLPWQRILLLAGGLAMVLLVVGAVIQWGPGLWQFVAGLGGDGEQGESSEVVPAAAPDPTPTEDPPVADPTEPPDLTDPPEPPEPPPAATAATPPEAPVTPPLAVPKEFSQAEVSSLPESTPEAESDPGSAPTPSVPAQKNLPHPADLPPNRRPDPPGPPLAKNQQKEPQDVASKKSGGFTDRIKNLFTKASSGFSKPEIVLEGILYNRVQPLALINGQTVGVGELVKGMDRTIKVIEITRKKVRLQDQGAIIELVLDAIAE